MKNDFAFSINLIYFVLNILTRLYLFCNKNALNELCKSAKVISPLRNLNGITPLRFVFLYWIITYFCLIFHNVVTSEHLWFRYFFSFLQSLVARIFIIFANVSGSMHVFCTIASSWQTSGLFERTKINKYMFMYVYIFFCKINEETTMIIGVMSLLMQYDRLKISYKMPRPNSHIRWELKPSTFALLSYKFIFSHYFNEIFNILLLLCDYRVHTHTRLSLKSKEAQINQKKYFIHKEKNRQYKKYAIHVQHKNT